MHRKIVHEGYSATERQIGTIYDGWRIVSRRQIPRLLRWLHDGKHWQFIGERIGLGALLADEWFYGCVSKEHQRANGRKWQ